MASVTATNTRADQTELLNRFIYHETIDVPLQGKIVHVAKEAATGWLNLSTLFPQLGFERTPRLLKAHLEKVCQEVRPGVDIALSFRQIGRPPQSAIWVDPQIALDLLRRLIPNVDLSIWAVRRTFCATTDFWYIEDPLSIVPDIQTMRTLSRSKGIQFLAKQHQFFDPKTDELKQRLCATLFQLGQVFDAQAISARDLPAAAIKSIFNQFREAGLFLDTPPPTIATTAALNVSPMDDVRSEIKAADEPWVEVSWKVSDEQAALRSYAQPSVVQYHHLFESEFPEPGKIKFDHPQVLTDFYTKHNVELYHVREQHDVYKSLKPDHITALYVVSTLELIFKLFRDRFVFQRYEDLVSRKPIHGTEAELIPSGVLGHATPQIPLPVLVYVVERFCIDNPTLPNLPPLASLRDPKTIKKIMKIAAAYLSYSPDHQHSLVSCENQQQVTDHSDAASERRKNRSEIRWPQHDIPVPDKAGVFYEPRVFLNCDLVLNVDLRIPFVPWSFVHLQDKYSDWFQKNSNGLSVRRPKPRAASVHNPPNDAVTSHQERARSAIEYIKSQYVVRRCWTFSTEPLVPDKQIGSIYVPFVKLWIKLLTKLKIHVEPVDSSDNSVYAPLFAVLQTLSALHPATHVMLRFLTAEQAVRLFTMLKWINRLELSERIYPRYGVSSPKTHVARLDVFVHHHDLIVYSVE